VDSWYDLRRVCAHFIRILPEATFGESVGNNEKCKASTDEATRMPDEGTRMSTDEGTRVTMKDLTWAEIVRGKKEMNEK